MKKLILKSLPPKKRFLLPALQEYELEAPFSTKTRYGELIVPAGFITDLASAEFLTWFISGSNEAAVVHDYLYRKPGSRKINGIKINRELADKIFEDLLEKAKFGFLKRKACSTLIYLLGKWSWRD